MMRLWEHDKKQNRTKIHRRGKLPYLMVAFAWMLLAVMALGGHAFAKDDPIPDNGIPVVYVRVDETGDKPTIEDMIDSPDHSVSCEGKLDIVVPEGFHYVDFPDNACDSVANLSMTIRGRGNSTWTRVDKRPFKIKLENRTDIFGLGANKHWVLLANAFDPTLMKDRITGWLGEAIGFDFTPRGVPVDLVMIGDKYGQKYLGSYYLSENVRVDKNRLDIKELKKTDTDEETITGGYLLQEPSQLKPSSPDRFVTRNGAKWGTHTPSFDTSEEGYDNPVQQEYIQGHIQKIEDALFADDYKNGDGTDYRDLMDLTSTARYWLVNEVSCNHDAYVTGSTYIYKDRDEDGKVAKLYWGPLWDYDFAWEVYDEIEGFYVNHVWLNPLLHDTEEGGFVKEIYKQWPVMKQALDEITRDGGLIDQYYEETKDSAQADRKIWPPENSGQSYKEDVDALKDWIQRRTAWIDENLGSLDHLIHRVKYVADGEVYLDTFARDGGGAAHPNKLPKKEGYVFLGWMDENGLIIKEDTPIYRDMILTPKYVSDEEATHVEDIAFRVAGDIKIYNVNAHYYTMFYTTLPADAQDQTVEWSVSDPDYATVTEDGIVDVKDPGDEPRRITITGRLKNGKTRELTLVVTNGEATFPESIRPEKEVVEMTVGQQSANCIYMEPFPSLIHAVFYRSDDESVVTVDSEYGVLTAVGIGTTKVHMITESYKAGLDDPIEQETEVTVVVREKKEPTPDPTPGPSPEPAPQPAKESIAKAGVSGIKSMTWTGQALTQSPSVELSGKALRKDLDYTVTYRNNKNVGTASVIITGKGNYSGEIRRTFRINPKGTSLSKLTKGRKAVHVKWKKQSKKMSEFRITGYQIQLASNKGFSRNKKTVIVKGYKKTSLKVRKLKAGKKYYIRIRTYLTEGGAKYYSPWSKVKTIKTK